MNIFYLSHDPKEAAIWQVDSHVVKMCLESCQLLCTTFHEYGIEAPYKATHRNHPSAIWVRESKANFNWLMAHTYELFIEYCRRYHKIHKSINVFRWCSENQLKLEFPQLDQTPIKLAMPDEYKVADPVQSYRNYYKYGKVHLHKWKMNKPYWID
jgi:hypothetical protein